MAGGQINGEFFQDYEAKEEGGFSFSLSLLSFPFFLLQDNGKRKYSWIYLNYINVKGWGKKKSAKQISTLGHLKFHPNIPSYLIKAFPRLNNSFPGYPFFRLKKTPFFFLLRFSCAQPFNGMICTIWKRSKHLHGIKFFTYFLFLLFILLLSNVIMLIIE